MKSLPPTGTVALLKILSPYLNDDLINELFPKKRGRGRRRLFSPAQLFRVTLLSLLTPAHSFNLLVQMLAENRPWREFAGLRNKRVLPDAKMLHQFRDRLDLTKVRTINRSLLHPLLENREISRKSVAIIDSTDLPAATRNFKKKPWSSHCQRRSYWSSYGQERQKPMVYRIQKAHATTLDSAIRICFVDPIGQLGGPGQSR